MNWKCLIKHNWHQIGSPVVIQGFFNRLHTNKVCLRCGNTYHGADVAMERHRKLMKRYEDESKLAEELWSKHG